MVFGVKKIDPKLLRHNNAKNPSPRGLYDQDVP